jgi:hypothetical protein
MRKNDQNLDKFMRHQMHLNHENERKEMQLNQIKNQEIEK